MNVETTSEYIRKRIDTFIFGSLKKCQAATPTKAQWDTHPDGPYKRFGIRPPVIIAEQTLQIIVSYCPELIAEQTAHLSHEELDSYLDGLEYIMGRITQHVLAGDDPELAMSKTENEFYDHAPEAQSFMSDVWSYVLDRDAL